MSLMKSRADFWAKLGLADRERRRIPLLLAVLVLGLLLMAVSSWADGGEQQEVPPQVEMSPAEGTEAALEAKLSQILSQIRGAGEVTVSVTFAQSGRTEYAVNASTTLRSTDEQDEQGGSRRTTEETQADTLVLAEGNDNPVTVQQTMPQVQGVLVVAQGGDDPDVRRRLFDALTYLLAVPAHRIVICPAE
ncbi:MAG: hypothetical protein IJB67_04265 [Firmicutes bacterium]|nr:hypothetical protein [Bacillota bacterium]